MFPELFAIGSFSFRTFTVFLLASFLLSAFVFWKKGKEEHYPEDQLFDGFLLSFVMGAITSRLGYILFHLDQFSINPLTWFDLFKNAGFNGLIGIVCGGFYIYRFANKKKWDAFEVLDFWTISLTLGLGLIYLGQFFDGSGVGYPTTLPIGIQFAGLFEPVHPVQLYQSVFFLILASYLSWVEFKYRNFLWYRAGKKSAQTGFLVAMALLTSGLFSFVISFVKPPLIEIVGTNMDQLLSLAVATIGGLVLYHRSGRPLPFTREKKKQQKRVERLRV